MKRKEVMRRNTEFKTGKPSHAQAGRAGHRSDWQRVWGRGSLCSPGSIMRAPPPHSSPGAPASGPRPQTRRSQHIPTSHSCL